ncbi:DUF4148 domain-containing protein [Caballeronia sp. RCC_10]|jgi:hypothetical protein|uniref:DUF4148 domain-containing protein n=1 Tax=Caballeronia sp. RCC_10 TaxID=3239227 RepID=UPI003525F2AB
MRDSHFARSINAVLTTAATLCIVGACTTGGDVSTRAQVRKDLATYRCAGFDPISDEITYPADVERAQARVAAGEDCASDRQPAVRP